MSESWSTAYMRWCFNLFPAYRGTGARCSYIAGDWKEIRIKLPLNWRTRNYVGTIFGGSIYAAADPMYMIMLIHLLGDDYVVWDKAAKVRFRKPGRSTLYATFTVDEKELDCIRSELELREKIDRVYGVDLVDAYGARHATVEKTLHIRRKSK